MVKKRTIDIEDLIKAFNKVFCADCRYWVEHSRQESSQRVKGRCHYLPNLIEREAGDWCSKGVSHEG